MELYFDDLTDTAMLPSYGSEEAAGMDLCADLYGMEAPADMFSIGPNRHALIKCGFAMALPKGFEAQVRPRSGLALKHGITVLNSPGTIDSDYRGEVGVILYNASGNVFTIRHGDRIAQMVIARHERPEIIDVGVEELSETVRGIGGFGSTGVQ